MLQYMAGDTYRESIPTIASGGGSASLDSIDVARVKRNGVTDGAVTVSVTEGETGLYDISFTIPEDYEPRDHVQVQIQGTLGDLQEWISLEPFHVQGQIVVDVETVITPSDPEQTTGHITVFTADHVPVEGAVVEIEILRLANGTTGSGISDPLVSQTTDSNGFAEFVGLPRLATYRVRIDAGRWFRGGTLDADTTPLAGSIGPAVED